MGGVEYQVTKVDPTNPETKGMVYQVHKVSEEVAATLGGKVYRARIIKDPTEPTVAGKVYQIVLIDDPDDPSVKGKVYNAILTGGSEAVVVGPAVSPLALDDAVADTMEYVKAYGGIEQGLPDGYTQLEYIGGTGTQYIDTGVLGTNVTAFELKGTIAANGGQNTQFIGGTNQSATSFFGSRAMGSAVTWYCMTAQGSSVGNPSHVCVVTSTIESTSSQPGTLYDTETGTTTEYAKFASATWGFGEENILLFGGSETRRSPNVTCYYLKLYTANGLVFYGIPAKNSSNVVGLYDVVSGTFFTNGGTGDFVAGSTVVPTPNAPMDIVSNNGVLKARHQSGLPLGYTLLEYITFDGTQYIDTGLAINNNTRVLFDVKRSTSSAQSNYPWLGGVRDYVNNTNINKKTLEFSNKNSTTMYLQYATSGEITLTVPNTTNRHTYDFDKNELYIDENLIYTATQETFTGNAAFLIGTVYSQGSVSTASMFYGDVYGFKLWQDGTNLSMNLIPAKRNSDNVVGMYDLVSGQFFTNAGTGDFVAGNTVSDPVEIYTDGTVETIEDTIGNTATAEMLLKVGDYKDVQSIIDGVVTRNVGVLVLDGTEDWVTSSGSSKKYAYFDYSGINANTETELYCTHFGVSVRNVPEESKMCVRLNRNGFLFCNNLLCIDNTTWTQYLAAQYAAGTPVILVYPLATPTTESVAGQTLQVQDGDNTLEITQASIDGLELEAEYEKEA